MSSPHACHVLVSTGGAAACAGNHQRPPKKRNTYSGYSKHFWSIAIPKDRWNEVVWTHRWYNPRDLRSETPVLRNKPRVWGQQNELTSDQAHWVPPPSSPPLRSFSREGGRVVHSAAPSSRCEQWSTLRMMLPSQGHCVRHRSPYWGTGTSATPTWSSRPPKRFPRINSPMTK